MKFDFFRAPKPAPPDARAVRDLWDAGHDTLDIARALGVHESVIANMMTRVLAAENTEQRIDLAQAQVRIEMLQTALRPQALYYPCLHLPPLAEKLLAILHEASSAPVSRATLNVRLFGEETLYGARAVAIDALVQFLRTHLRLHAVFIKQRGDAWLIDHDDSMRLDAFASAGSL